MKRIILTTILTIVFSFTGYAQENSEQSDQNDGRNAALIWFVKEGIECTLANEELKRLMAVHYAMNEIFQIDVTSNSYGLVDARLENNRELFDSLIFRSLGILEQSGIPEDTLVKIVTEQRLATSAKIAERRAVKDLATINDVIIKTFAYVKKCRAWAKEQTGE